LADAVHAIADQPESARTMGVRGRKLCEEYYNLDRYARDLHRYFESL
jgi:hypothetical protein